MLIGTAGPWGLAAMIAGAVVMSLGMAPVIAIGNEMMITAAPPERAGAASAMAETAAGVCALRSAWRCSAASGR
ncbi:MAG: hypothetical protein U1F49_20525 [Rubrivivax sp.]